jgi:AhpD family alkylhydroperoxidase
MNLVEEFNTYRSRMNERILSEDNKVIKRFFNLDTNAYSEGAVDVKTKEMIGLSCSMVLRCDDCIRYHLEKCFEVGISREQVFEVFSIAMVIGGSIFFPLLRRAVEFWEELENQGNA